MDSARLSSRSNRSEDAVLASHVTNWAELRFGKRLKKWAQSARDRVRSNHPELEPEIRARERKICVYHTLTESWYSKTAAAVGLFLCICIALSTIAFILETVPEYERAPGWGAYFFYAECFFVVIFTIEIILKFWSTPQTTKEFFKDVLNVIDVLSILPFYIEMLIVLFVGSQVFKLDLRLLRAFRLMRMLKMGRFSGELQLLADGLIRARVSFALLCGTLVLGTVMFSTIMWITERGTWNSTLQCYSRPGEVFFNGCSPFESVPLGFWWAITTMTTVGYGDAFPITPVGRCIAGVAMLAGIFCVALPTGILCTEFSKLFDERARESKKDNVTSEICRRPKVELELFLSSEKLFKANEDYQEQLVYIKRLAYVYIETRNNFTPAEAEQCLKMDPMYTAFGEKLAMSMDAMTNYVRRVSHGLAAKHYADAFKTSDLSKRLLVAAQTRPDSGRA